MPTLEEQRKHYEENWEQNAPLLGSATMPADPSPHYWIGIPLERSLYADMEKISARLRRCSENKTHRWLPPEDMHISLALPGKVNEAYGEKDLPRIVSRLQGIAQRFRRLMLDLGDMNCFPHVLLREVYSQDGSLFMLHNAIADALPFSREPQFRYERFTPHMSLCYLQEVDPAIARCIGESRSLALSPMDASRIRFLEVTGAHPNKMKKLIADIEMGTGKLL